MALLLPEGDIGSSTTDLLDVVEPAHHHDRTLVEEDGEDDDELDKPQTPPKPWWRRSSPWWILVAMPLTSIAMATTIAPRVEIYTHLACMAHRPDSSTELDLNGIGDIASWNAPRTAVAWTSLSTQLDSPPVSGDESPPVGLPSPSERCKEDPEVLAAVTRLIAIMTTTLGVLGCITTAWWGQLSDRWGRTKVMRFVILGMLFGDFNFILVARYSKVLPGGYYFLIASPIVDGLLGGMSTASSTMNAYISDCVEPRHRARTFSLIGGLLFSGFAIGPWLGGRIIHYTGDLLSVFYLAAFIHIIGIIYWVVAVPESLPDDIRMANIATQQELIAKELAEDPGFSPRKLFKFARPLKMLLPKPRDPLNPRKGKDWNLTLLVAAHSCAIIMMGSYPYKMTYAQRIFHWGSQELGNWLSIVGIVRAIVLLVILPIVIKLFKLRPQPIQLDGEEADIESAPRPPPPSRVVSQSRVRATASRAASLVSMIRTPTMAHPGAFDLYLARVSLLLEMGSYVGALFATSGNTFLAATALAALGGGFNPAVSSLALLLGGSTENGKLFGAMSVMSTIASQVFGPSLFALTMVYTAKSFPPAIFAVSVAALATAFVITLFIRLPPVTVASYHRVMGTGGRDRDATLVGSSSSAAGTWAAATKTPKYAGPEIVVTDAENRG